jgi:ligand-binding sensor domain-containing protein/DNA-binding CsgD family transcriptional regulator
MTTSILHQPLNFDLHPCFGLRCALVFLFGFGAMGFGFSQGNLRNFTKDDYRGGTQNWAIEQDELTRLYVANNEGLLVYDGTNWQLYPVPNKTILRSIAFGEDGKLYVGAQDELGYFEPDQVGRLKFHSLKASLPPEAQKFADVWQVIVNQDAIYFRTQEIILRLDGKKCTVFPSQSAWLSLHNHKGQMLAHDKELGLLSYQNHQWQPFIAAKSLPKNFLITDLIAYQPEVSLVSTFSHGLFWLVGNEFKPFAPLGIDSKEHITVLRLLPDSSLLLGTYFNGFYRVSTKGQILNHISTQSGMSNNTVRCLFADPDGGVWAGLDYGLTFFPLNNAITHLNPLVFNSGTGYDAKILNQKIYFALSTGLFLQPLNSSDLSQNRLPYTTLMSGLTWNLSMIENQLWVGRDDGLFVFQNQNARPVAQSTGFWSCLPLTQTDGSPVVAGNYRGVDIFEIQDLSFERKDKIPNFNESSRYIQTDDSSIWVSHPYRGIYRILLKDKSIVLFSKKDGLPTDLDNHVFKIKGKIVFATPKGIFEYQYHTNKISKAQEYQSIFAEKPIRYLKEDSEGNIWFVQEKMVGMVDYGEAEPKVHYFPELTNRIASGFENIFPYDKNNILVGGEIGFYHLNYEKYMENIKPFSVYISQVKATASADSVIFGGYLSKEKRNNREISVPYKLNSLLFSYSFSAQGQPQNLEYSYRLEGFDKNWSEWNNQTHKEYTNLAAGNYSFKVKARKSPSQESSIGQFDFTIIAPWYQTLWAYLAYTLLFFGFLFAILKYQANRYKKKQIAKRKVDLERFEQEQKQLAYLHQLEMAKSEQEIAHLQNEKLDAEIKHKNAELANAAMTLVQKKEFILKLKKELQQLQKSIKIGEDNTELKKLLKLLAEEEKLDQEWDNFSLHFNNVHGNFLTILKKNHPALNPHDLRLCAYLLMNLTSKEIAPLLGISLRGVEISRYRLRKKLSLSTETNLVDYLLNLKTKTEDSQT